MSEAMKMRRDISAIADCMPGDSVTIAGVVSSVCLHPADQAPSLEVEVADDSGHMTVVWLGRRQIPGIEAGRRIVVCGRMTHTADHPVIFNPKYQLRPLGDVDD